MILPYHVNLGRMEFSEGTGAAHDNAERSKPSPRIFGKHHSTNDGCGDNRGGVCLDGATSFMKCRRDRERPQMGRSKKATPSLVCAGRHGNTRVENEEVGGSPERK